MIKKFFNLLLAAALALSFVAPSFADLPNIFATMPAGNVSASLLDENFTFLETQGVQGFATTGTANSYIASPQDAWTVGYSSYIGRALTVVPNFTNTGSATVNVSGLGSASIYKNSLGVSTALASGDIVNGIPAILICDGTGFLLANPTPAVAVSNSTAGGFVNKFRNPDFDVAQRGVTGTTTSSSGVYTLDGWIAGSDGTRTLTWTQTYGSANGHAINFLELAAAGSATDTFLKQRIESTIASPLSGQTVTVQVTVINDTAGTITPTLTVKHANAQDNWASSTTDVNAVSLQPIVASSAGTLAYTFSASSSAANGLEVSWDFGSALAGSNALIYYPDIRLTPGVTTGLNNSPPLNETRPIAAELPLNQRYLYCIGGIAGPFGTGLASSTTAAGFFIPLPVNMRIAPTAIANTTVADYSIFTYANASVAAITALTFARASVSGVNVTTTVSSGLTSSTPYQLETVTPLVGNSCFTGAEL